MTPAGLADLLDVLSRIGALTMAILIIIAFLTERIVPRGRMEEMRKQRDELLEQQSLAEDALLHRVAEDLRLLLADRMKHE